MDKKIKDYIAEHKLSDDDIYARLSAEIADADKKDKEEQQEESEEKDLDADAESGEQDSKDEEDASTEQPDMKEMIKEMITEELGKMRRGKKPPKVVKKPKEPTKTVKYNFNQEFGEI